MEIFENDQKAFFNWSRNSKSMENVVFPEKLWPLTSDTDRI